MYVITRKNYLARNLMKMQKAFPDEYKFFPRTWIMPQEAGPFKMQFQQNQITKRRKQTYIAKPDCLSQGKGIFLSKNYDKIVRRTSDNEFGWVVQEYLDRPHLVEDLKYDLRIYVLLYGINPMRVYIHEKGLARFATEPYVAPKGSNMDNMFMHLTNYAINKNNEAFKENSGGGKGKYEEYDDEDSAEESGHKRSLRAILKIILQSGGNPEKVMRSIKDIIVKTLIVGQPFMSHIYRSC